MVSNRNKRLFAAGGAALSLAIALAGCSSTSSSPANDKKPFVVFATLALTGPLSSIAEANEQGLKAATTAINKGGGIDGRKIQLVVVDDQLNPTTAVTLLQQQIDKQKPDLVIAGNTSDEALAMAPLLTRNHIFSSGQQASTDLDDPAKYPYHFSYAVPDDLQVDAMAQQLKAKGYTKVAMLDSNDALGSATAAAAVSVFKTDGIALTQATYSDTDLDMTAQLQSLQAGKPQALLLQAFGAPAGYALKSRTKLGWTIPTFGFSDAGSTDLASISSKADWDNVKILVFSVLSPSAKRTSGYTVLQNSLKSQGAKFGATLNQYTSMWDILHIFQYAVAHAKGTTPAAIQKSYESIDLKGDSNILGFPVIKYSSTDHFLSMTATTAFTFVKPGPVVAGGLIQQ